MNGRRAIYFQGTNAFRMFPFTTGWTQAEAFLVLLSQGPTTNPPTGLWHICSGAYASVYPDSSEHVFESFGMAGSLDTGIPPISLGSPHLYDVASLTNSWFNRWNASGGYLQPSNSVAFDTDLRLGWGANVSYFHGYIAELMIFNRGLTDDERAAVAANYLRRRFNLW